MISLALMAIFGVIFASASQAETMVVLRKEARADMRCTDRGDICISLNRYVADTCQAIETAARRNSLDPHYFARLLWKESLFDASAVSPAGAQGIAQFMPGTAALRGLDDPFNPAKALVASARYLHDLTSELGNVGLAAVAYNAGEARAARFMDDNAGLPLETRDYVLAITGYSAEKWRDAPPATLDVSLDRDSSFQDACVDRAENRNLREFRTTVPLKPWGVLLASNRSAAVVERMVERSRSQVSDLIGGEQVHYGHIRLPGMAGRRHAGQIGRDSRAEADGLCSRMRARGLACIVVKN